MCLAVPARIVELADDRAVVDAMGNRWKCRTTLTPDVKLGDIVLIHAGFAITTIDEEEAQKTWELIAEFDEFQKEQEKGSPIE
ncbi:MAG: HypC/HybG/HupF family hydrogenase formation chaperone [Planctomycetota bacterium]|nr:MAG: HypC/HybG/HupF family hydrogenase formation chaperone [Planctomycetota bacterium]